MVGQVILLALSALGFETMRAENRIVEATWASPPYKVTGPLVSVIIPTYNEEKYLPSLLSSLTNQTYDNIEVLVVDNISEDSTVRIAEESGAKIFVNPDFNIGKSRNVGANNSHGEILVFIDADTIPENIAIEKTVQSILGGMALVYTNHCCIDSTFQSLMRVSSGIFSPKLMNVSGCYLGVSREAFMEIGGFDESALAQEGRGEDVEFATAIARTFGLDKIGYFRTVYSATSARRQKAEGYLVPKHFQSRTIRRYG